jgi:hypothetical protein
MIRSDIQSYFEQARRIVLAVALFVYFTVLVIAASPASPFHRACDRTFKGPLNYWGLYNSYGVFAPDPASYNQIFRAVVKFRDGKVKTWMFPYLMQWKDDDCQRQFKLAWEEWQYYFLWSKDNLVLVTDAAKYVAWLHRSPDNPPVAVTIFRDFSDIVPPVSETKPLPPLPQVSEEIMEYSVKPEDLR